MNHSCPNCGISLKRRLLKREPLEARVGGLPVTIPVCPRCGVHLQPNTSRLEVAIGVIAMITAVSVISLALNFASQAHLVFWLAGVAILFLGVMFWTSNILLKDWKRWKIYQSWQVSISMANTRLSRCVDGLYPRTKTCNGSLAVVDHYSQSGSALWRTAEARLNMQRNLASGPKWLITIFFRTNTSVDLCKKRVSIQNEITR